MAATPGMTLETYLRAKGPLPEAQVKRLACHLAAQLEREAAAVPSRRAPVVHTGRLFLGPDGKVRLEPIAQDDLALPVAAGFPGHASPEEIRGQPGDFRSSLYSLGCTLYELVTGELPYTGASPKDVLKAHLSGEIPDPRARGAALSDGFARALQELLRKDPEQRIQTVPELVRRLRLSDRAASLPEPSTRTDGAPRRRTAPPGRRLAAERGRLPAAAAPAPNAARRTRSAVREEGRRGRERGLHTHGRFARDGGSARLRDRRRAPPEDPFEPEEAAAEYPIAHRKMYPFTIGGAVVGLLFGCLVLVSLRESTEETESYERERDAEMAAKKLGEVKDAFRKRYGEESKATSTLFAQQKAILDGGGSARVVEGTLEQQLGSSYFNKPGALSLAALWADAAGRVREEDRLAKTGGVRFEDYVAEFNKLYDGGLYFPAMEKIREAERHFRKEKEAEIDELFLKAEAAMVAQWNRDEQKIKDLVLQGEVDKAYRTIDQAVRYGDSQIRTVAEATRREIERQSAAMSALGERKEAEPDFDPEKALEDLQNTGDDGGDPGLDDFDPEKELEELRGGDQ